MTKLTESMKICIKSGDRLLEDAENLQIFKRYASVYALIKLAQEEYAKCFILKLVEAGVLKLTKEVRRSLNHHISKQLMLLILEYINPNTNEFLRKINSKTCFKISPRAVDAINIYIYEILHK
jgi:AbiV family abortive infection protein